MKICQLAREYFFNRIETLKVILVGRDLEEIRKFLPRFSIEEVSADPDCVITYGGDGTLVGAERDFPKIPKVPIRNSKWCKKCLKHTTECILQRLVDGDLERKLQRKIEARRNGQTQLAMNEVGLHMANRVSTARGSC